LILDKRAAEGPQRPVACVGERACRTSSRRNCCCGHTSNSSSAASNLKNSDHHDSGDHPVGSGFVESFAHPGGNLTGLANMYGDLTAKLLEVLHLILPDAKKIAVLMSSNPTHPPLLKVASAAAEAIGLSTIPIVAPTVADLDQAFQAIGKNHYDAVYVLADPFGRPLFLWPLPLEFLLSTK